MLSHENYDNISIMNDKTIEASVVTGYMNIVSGDIVIRRNRPEYIWHLPVDNVRIPMYSGSVIKFNHQKRISQLFTNVLLLSVSELFVQFLKTHNDQY